MSYQITIKNNETGEVHIDEEIVGVCGAIQKTDTDTGVLLITKCNLLEYCAMLKGAQNAILRAKLSNPLAATIVTEASKMKEEDEDETV